jgi:hypothetical protein
LLTALGQRFAVGVGCAGGCVGFGVGWTGGCVGVAVGGVVFCFVGVGVITAPCAATVATVVAVGVVPLLAVDWDLLAPGNATDTEQMQRNKTATITPQPIPSFVRLRRVRYQFKRRLRGAGGGGACWY